MASEMIFQTAKGEAVYGELTWRLLSGKGGDAELLSTAREVDAKYAARIQTQTPATQGKKTYLRKAAGYYQSGMDDAGSPKKRAHSLAAAFAQFLTPRIPAGLLLMQHISGNSLDEKAQDRYIVIAVENGLPVIDKCYVSLEAAQEVALQYVRAASQDIRVFADELGTMSGADVLEGGTQALQAELARYLGSATAVRSTPFDMLRVGLPLVLLLGAALGWYVYAQQEAAKAAALALAKKQAEDPLPKYHAALAAQRVQAGFTGESLQGAFTALSKTPTKIPKDGSGWQLNTVECAAAATGTVLPTAAAADKTSNIVSNGGTPLTCRFVWMRKSGNTNQLQAAIPSHVLHLGQSSEAINLNQAQTVLQLAVNPQALPAQLLAFDAFMQGGGINTLQDWASSGQTVQLGPVALWPSIPGLSPSSKIPGSVRAGALEVGNIPLARLAEVLTAQPNNMLWSSFAVAVSGNDKDIMAAARAKVKGLYYVQN